MKTFELSRRSTKNGRRKFKAVLCEVYEDSTIDQVNEVGTKYNRNGCSFIRKYVEKTLDTIKGMSMRVEFLDEERTEIAGHGSTGQEDGIPVFEDAVVIGTFNKGYIEDVEQEDGSVRSFCIGEGEIDAMCYNNFCKKLDKDIHDGNAPDGSVEIYRKDENDGILYLYGYKDIGRIPTEFCFSGYALLGVTPSDPEARLLELNEKENKEEPVMNEQELKNLISQVVTELNNQKSEINQIQVDCAQQIAEANARVEAVTAEKNEIQASAERIQTELENARAEIQEKYKEIDNLYTECEALRKALGEAKAKERLGEMNSAIADFTEDEKAYAQAEIDAFTADPVNSEINSVVNKIWEGIGKKAKEASAQEIVSEQNSANIEDIFGTVELGTTNIEECSIF